MALYLPRDESDVDLYLSGDELDMGPYLPSDSATAPDPADMMDMLAGALEFDAAATSGRKTWRTEPGFDLVAKLDLDLVTESGLDLNWDLRSTYRSALQSHSSGGTWRS